MRIISGKYRGHQLLAPKGKTTRPTTDRVRENMFNIISSMQTAGTTPKWSEQNVLDAFCGSGALGIEAISRGAKTALFIDQDKHAVEICSKNIKFCEIPRDIATIKKQNALNVTCNTNTSLSYTMVFIDPPYGMSLGITFLNVLKHHGWLAGNALCILETDKKHPEDIPSDVFLIDERMYGRVRLQFLKIDNG